MILISGDAIITMLFVASFDSSDCAVGCRSKAFPEQMKAQARNPLLQSAPRQRKSTNLMNIGHADDDSDDSDASEHDPFEDDEGKPSKGSFNPSERNRLLDAMRSLGASDWAALQNKARLQRKELSDVRTLGLLMDSMLNKGDGAALLSELSAEDRELFTADDQLQKKIQHGSSQYAKNMAVRASLCKWFAEQEQPIVVQWPGEGESEGRPAPWWTADMDR